MGTAQGKPEIFHLIMIKPTHYDDNGYPIQWMYSPIPSNSLASVYGLADDCVKRQAMGKNIDVRLTVIDETNTRVHAGKLARMIRDDNAKSLVAMVGVQSNQFPRAVDLSRRFLKHGLQVCIGGFHVSGCTSMLGEMPDDMKEAQDLGISFFCGEAEEGRFEQVMKDAYAGEMKPIYNHLMQLPNLEGEPIPFMPTTNVRKTFGEFTSFDVGRGCPFECSFCTIINVQGRKSRFRNGDDLRKIVRENASQGIHKYFITDDNLARNKNWEQLFDVLIEMKEKEGYPLRHIIQVDTMTHRIPGFIEKAVRAGVVHVFIGLENINPDNLLAAKKRQNKITEYRKMLLEWKKYPVVLTAGYIIGFPNDTKDSVIRDVEIIKKELPIDLLYFSFLTPLPGSEDHRRMLTAGEWMDPDMNKYDLNHRVSHHSKMSDQEWEEAYKEAWKTFYTFEHMETVVTRHVALKSKRIRTTAKRMLWYHFFPLYCGVHPLEGGYFPLRFRHDRRSTFKTQNPVTFYSRYLWDIVKFHGRLTYLHLRMWAMWTRVRKDPRSLEYTDLALTPPDMEDEYENFGLYKDTTGGKEAVEKRQKQDARRANVKLVDAAE